MHTPLKAYRRLWVPELAVLLAVAAASIALFAWTDLDVETARPYFRAGEANPWPLAQETLWAVLYGAAPWVTASLALAGIAALVAGFRRPALRRWRTYGTFILLSVALGPGLVVNGVLKDHWGRPRPRQIEEFGGLYPYVPPVLVAETPGRSFPCGHCSVGYLYALGWWIWRRSHPRRAAVSLATGLAAGTLLGLGRLAAGGHFLSDAIWAALVAYGIAHVLYYHVLRIPAREDARGPVYPLLDRNPRLRRLSIGAAILLTVGIVAGGIVASPHHRHLDTRVSLEAYPAAPAVLELRGETLDVELRLVSSPANQIAIVGDIHGFGLPGNELDARWEYDAEPVPTLRYRVLTRGWFPDIDGLVRVQVPFDALQVVRVDVARGNVVVTGDRAARGEPRLDLRTGEGVVRQP